MINLNNVGKYVINGACIGGIWGAGLAYSQFKRMCSLDVIFHDKLNNVVETETIYSPTCKDDLLRFDMSGGAILGGVVGLIYGIAKELFNNYGTR